MVLKKNDYYLNKLYKNPKARIAEYLAIPDQKRAEIFLLLRRHIQFEVAKGLNNDQRKLLLEALDPDDATDVLQFFDKNTQKNLIESLSNDIQE